MPKLNKWSLTTRPPSSAYQPPEHMLPCLQGNVEGHPTFPDGDHILTAAIVKITETEVVTKTKTYELGDIDPAYESEFPNAHKRLIKQYNGKGS